MSNNDALLTDLCAICHINEIKYTCPRCSIHTCSLPCVKKHKAWAQCSGVRNPAEYRKRADLATDSSIDKDFNFITGVERAITRADDNVIERKIHLAPARQLGWRESRAKVDVEIENRGVKVIKAPKGLSRSKSNKTHWTSQHKGIMWTVEWICPDGEKIVGSVLETRTIEEAFVNTVGKKKVRAKRKMSAGNPLEGRDRVKKIARQDSKPEQPDTPEDTSNIPDTTVDTNEIETSTAKKDPTAGLYFYLHKPNTPSKFKCLIPLSSDHSLRNALEGKTVLEFPTIFIKHTGPEELEEPFITEIHYMSQHGEDLVVKETGTLEDGEIDTSSVSTIPSAVDSAKVLEVLAKDLTT